MWHSGLVGSSLKASHRRPLTWSSTLYWLVLKSYLGILPSFSWAYPIRNKTYISNCNCNSNCFVSKICKPGSTTFHFCFELNHWRALQISAENTLLEMKFAVTHSLSVCYTKGSRSGQDFPCWLSLDSAPPDIRTLRLPVSYVKICQNGSARPLDAMTVLELRVEGTVHPMCRYHPLSRPKRLIAKETKEEEQGHSPSWEYLAQGGAGEAALCLLWKEVCGLFQCTAPLHETF